MFHLYRWNITGRVECSGFTQRTRGDQSVRAESPAHFYTSRFHHLLTACKRATGSNRQRPPGPMEVTKWDIGAALELLENTPDANLKTARDR